MLHPFFPTPFVPQGISLFFQLLLPFRPAPIPATLFLRPDADPRDDPDQ